MRHRVRIVAFAAGATLALAGVPASAAASLPLVEGESIAHLTPTDATLEASVNPEGLETSFRLRLRYGCGIAGGEMCPQYCIPDEPCPGPVNGPVEIPLPGGELPPSSETQHIALDLNEAGVLLQPGTRYSYSLEATNLTGTTKGPSQIFTTPVAPPAVDGESVSGLSQTDATLEALIDPESAETGADAQFQLVADPREYLPTFACPSDLGASSLCELMPQAGGLPLEFVAAATQDRSVSLDLAHAGVKLAPGTTYRFRVITARAAWAFDWIAWEDPIVYGPDDTFTTPAAGTRPPVVDGGGTSTPPSPYGTTLAAPSTGMVGVAAASASKPASAPSASKKPCTATTRRKRGTEKATAHRRAKPHHGKSRHHHAKPGACSAQRPR